MDVQNSPCENPLPLWDVMSPLFIFETFNWNLKTGLNFIARMNYLHKSDLQCPIGE